MTPCNAHLSNSRATPRPVILTLGICLALLPTACGGGQRKSHTVKTAASTIRSSAPAWRPGSPVPKITAALIAQAGYGLTQANTNPGSVDEVFGSVPAAVHVNPSAKTLNDQYARFGRCMAEHLRIHDAAHELALLVAYNRKDRATQTAVEEASSVCEAFAITPDASYRQSLKTNP
jgi:hypothetical protein